jgi:hypothetical protein
MCRELWRRSLRIEGEKRAYSLHTARTDRSKYTFIQGCGTGKFEDGSGSDILSEYGSGSGSGSATLLLL